MIYYDKPFLIVHYDEAVKCIIMEWKGFAFTNEMREGHNKGLELLKEKKAFRWISDLRLAKTVAEDDQEWLREDWKPRLLEAGMRYSAIIVPQSALGRIQMKTLMERSKDKIAERRYFDDIREAKAWLLTTNKAER
jgi:hypothetical protein